MVAFIDSVFVALSQPLGWLWGVAALVAAMALAALIWRWKRPGARWLALVVAIGGLGLGAALATPYALSASRSRDPLGPFKVQEADLVLTPDAANGAAGPIRMRIWFPTTAAPGPRLTLDGCAALAASPLAADGGSRRLILYMPHLAGRSDDNAARLSFLASHGYVAVAFDDIAQDPAPAGATPDEEAVRFESGDFSTQDEYDSGIARFDIRVRRQAQKALSGLDGLTACAASNAASPWSRTLDYGHVGFLGFSFGGATAAEAATMDERIAAVANLDGTLFGQAFGGEVRAPYFFVMSGRSFGTKAEMMSKDPVQRYLSRTWARDLHEEARLLERPDSAGIRIDGAVHLSLCDVVFEPHASRLWVLKNPIAFYNAVNHYTLKFFDARLRGDTAAADGLRTSTQPFVQVLGKDMPWPPPQDATGAPIG